MFAEPITCPFTILIDTAEGQPFTFDGIHADADKDNLPLAIPRRYECLGRYPDSLGDYCIDGLYGFAHVERKSIDDVWATVLGWETPDEKAKGLASRRRRFERELANLAAIPAGLVVVEATEAQCLELMPEWGVRDVDLNRKIFWRSINSFNQRFKVNWRWCESRRVAEVQTFRWFERYWKRELTKKERQAALARAERR